MSTNSDGDGMGVMGALICLSLSAVFVVYRCVGTDASRADAIHAVEQNQLRQVKLTGPGMLRCADDDAYGAEFTAVNRDGGIARGVVCCGVFKGCTVRW